MLHDLGISFETVLLLLCSLATIILIRCYSGSWSLRKQVETSIGDFFVYISFDRQTVASLSIWEYFVLPVTRPQHATLQQLLVLWIKRLLPVFTFICWIIWLVVLWEFIEVWSLVIGFIILVIGLSCVSYLRWFNSMVRDETFVAMRIHWRQWFVTLLLLVVYLTATDQVWYFAIVTGFYIAAFIVSVVFTFVFVLFEVHMCTKTYEAPSQVLQRRPLKEWNKYFLLLGSFFLSVSLVAWCLQLVWLFAVNAIVFILTLVSSFGITREWQFTEPLWYQSFKAHMTGTRVYWLLMGLSLIVIVVYSLIHQVALVMIGIWAIVLLGIELFGYMFWIRTIWAIFYQDTWVDERENWELNSSVTNILIKYMEVTLYFVLFIGLIILVQQVAYIALAFLVVYVAYFIVYAFFSWANRFWRTSHRANKRLLMGILALLALLLVMVPIIMSLVVVHDTQANVGKAISVTAKVPPAPDYSKDYCKGDGLTKMQSSMELSGKKIVGIYSIESILPSSDCAYKFMNTAAVLMPIASASGQNVLLVVQRGFDSDGRAHYDVVFGSQHWLLTKREPRDHVRMYILNVKPTSAQLVYFTEELHIRDTKSNYHPILASAI